MQVVRGLVSGCRRSVTGGQNEDGKLVNQILTFQIGRQAVELTMSGMPQIEDNHEVAVAGNLKRGTLVGLAFMNFSNGTYDRRHGSLWGNCFGFGLLLLVGMLLALAFPPLLFIVPFVLFPLGAGAYNAWRATQALGLARSATGHPE